MGKTIEVEEGLFVLSRSLLESTADAMKRFEGDPRGLTPKLMKSWRASIEKANRSLRRAASKRWRETGRE